MKPDQLPECYVEANDNHWICYVMEYDDEGMIHVEERDIDGIIEVVRTCRICGQCDVYYPL